MRTRLKLKPGQAGTKKLLMKYGDQLVCVRYRYDERRKKRYKTVEVIVDEVEWKPKVKAKTLTAGTVVGVKVGVEEVELRKRVRQAGGRWNGERRLWELRYDRVLEMGLAGRIRAKSI